MGYAADSVRLLVVPPAPSLREFVRGYWFIEDRSGAHAGVPVVTAPHASAIVTINFGTPNVGEFGPRPPLVSVLGMQSRARTWRSGPDSDFVMVMLTLPGLARWFPGAGATADRLVDWAGAFGDGEARRLIAGLPHCRGAAAIAGALDRWLGRRLAARGPVAEFERFVVAYRMLSQRGRVEDAASSVGVSARQLERWFAVHVGHSPKSVAGLHRLQRSLRALQMREPEGPGFSDDAHRIRAWRRHLGTTPGRYRRRPPSLLAETFAPRVVGGTEPLAHFL